MVMRRLMFGIIRRRLWGRGRLLIFFEQFHELFALDLTDFVLGLADDTIKRRLYIVGGSAELDEKFAALAHDFREPARSNKDEKDDSEDDDFEKTQSKHDDATLVDLAVMLNRFIQFFKPFIALTGAKIERKR